MRTFACQTCEQLVFFENTECLNCGSRLGFDWGTREIVTAPEAPWCANAALAGCNWLVREPDLLCESCSLTRTRPDDTDQIGLAAFRGAEAAKRRLVFELGELGLLGKRGRTPLSHAPPLRFDFLSSARRPVTTGHAEGVVTLDLAESDDIHRERTRVELGEPYRTVLGHLRHEVGHYYWTVLAAPDPECVSAARALFGDEGADYAAALERHYAQGPPQDWPARYVSAYATMHPMEDWAETFAHYLHIRDTLQTAASHRVRVLGPEAVARERPVDDLVSVPRDGERDFEAIIEDWLPLTYALNALNRSMGREGLYPFVLTEPAIAKLAFVHDLVTGKTGTDPAFSRA